MLVPLCRGLVLVFMLYQDYLIFSKNNKGMIKKWGLYDVIFGNCAYKFYNIFYTLSLILHWFYYVCLYRRSSDISNQMKDCEELRLKQTQAEQKIKVQIYSCSFVLFCCWLHWQDQILLIFLNWLVGTKFLY